MDMCQKGMPQFPTGKQDKGTAYMHCLLKLTCDATCHGGINSWSHHTQGASILLESTSRYEFRSVCVYMQLIDIHQRAIATMPQSSVASFPCHYSRKGKRGVAHTAELHIQQTHLQPGTRNAYARMRAALGSLLQH